MLDTITSFFAPLQVIIQNLLNSAAVSFDLPILDWIQANLRSDILDIAMPYITMLGDEGIFWIACAVILMFTKKHTKTGLGMGFAMLLGLLVCNIILKPWVARLRPYDFQLQVLGKEIQLIVGAMHDFAFPSGHTIASFEACTVLMLNSKKLGIPATILAILIAFSRLYLYVHYPTDVITSVVLGILFGIIGNAIAQKIRIKRGKYERR